MKKTKIMVKTEIWKLKMRFSEWGMNMTVKRCRPFWMTQRREGRDAIPDDPQSLAQTLSEFGFDLLVVVRWRQYGLLKIRLYFSYYPNTLHFVCQIYC